MDHYKKQRSSLRHEPDNITDFQISIRINKRSITGFLGNISETGVTILLPAAEKANIEKEANIEGSISSIQEKIAFEYQGRVKWIQKKEIKKEVFTIIGVGFQMGFILPEPFYKMKLKKGQ